MKHPTYELHLNTAIERHCLQASVTGNTNTNINGAKAAESYKIIGIGCSAHITCHCLQPGVDCLPFDAQSFAVKVYKYCHV